MIEISASHDNGHCNLSSHSPNAIKATAPRSCELSHFLAQLCFRAAVSASGSQISITFDVSPVVYKALYTFTVRFYHSMWELHKFFVDIDKQIYPVTTVKSVPFPMSKVRTLSITDLHNLTPVPRSMFHEFFIRPRRQNVPTRYWQLSWNYLVLFSVSLF